MTITAGVVGYDHPHGFTGAPSKLGGSQVGACYACAHRNGTPSNGNNLSPFGCLSDAVFLYTPPSFFYVETPTDTVRNSRRFSTSLNWGILGENWRYFNVLCSGLHTPPPHKRTP